MFSKNTVSREIVEYFSFFQLASRVVMQEKRIQSGTFIFTKMDNKQ